jgi:hypothetical protein
MIKSTRGKQWKKGKHSAAQARGARLQQQSALDL